MILKELGRSARRGALRKMVFVLAAAVGILGVLPRVSAAGMIPADEVSSSVLRAENMAKIQALLEREEIAARLADYGLTEEEIQARLDQLSDEQVAEIAAQIDQLNPGGDAVGLVVGVLLIVLLILLILWLLGYINPHQFSTQLQKIKEMNQPGK